MPRNKTDTRTRILKTTWKLMEAKPGNTFSMSDIAKAVGLSRQAVYLHFDSRTKLIIATSKYVDEVKGLKERFELFRAASTGAEKLDACVELWGNYIPEIYGLAKALMAAKDTDAAMAATWNGNMQSLRGICKDTIDTLDREGLLNPGWPKTKAVDMFWTMISISNWEQLTVECGWSTALYVKRMKAQLRSTFVA